MKVLPAEPPVTRQDHELELPPITNKVRRYEEIVMASRRLGATEDQHSRVTTPKSILQSEG